MQNATTSYQSFRCKLEQEYQLLSNEIANYSIIQRADEKLFAEVEDFLESIRANRRKFKREIFKLNCTCPETYKDSTYVASQITDIERTIDRIEEIDNEFMEMMNWFDIPTDNNTHII